MNQMRFLFLAMTLLSVPVFAADQWHTDQTKSTLTFIALQSGGETEGKFPEFTASVRFSPQDLPGSKFDVVINMASAATGDVDRDQTLRGADMLWVSRYPEAHYVTTGFTALGGNNYKADGTLTIRGTTLPVPLSFTFAATGQTGTLTGTAGIKRLAFGVGKGEWASTDSVADDVRVKFTLRLTK